MVSLGSIRRHVVVDPRDQYLYGGGASYCIVDAKKDIFPPQCILDEWRILVNITSQCTTILVKLISSILSHIICPPLRWDSISSSRNVLDEIIRISLSKIRFSGHTLKSVPWEDHWRKKGASCTAFFFSFRSPSYGKVGSHGTTTLNLGIITYSVYNK